VLLGGHVGLPRDRAAQLDELHDLRHDQQRGVAGRDVLAGRVEDPLPQGELPDPERLQEVGQGDPLRHPAGGLLARHREVRPPGRLSCVQPGQEGQEDGPDVRGDVIAQLLVVARWIGGHFRPDRVDRRSDHLVQRLLHRGGDPLRARMRSAERLHRHPTLHHGLSWDQDAGDCGQTTTR